MAGAIEWPAQYVGKVQFATGGRDRPFVDCWGLVRLVLIEQRGIVLPAWDTLTERRIHDVDATIRSERDRPEWYLVEFRQDAREFDIVEMRGLYWRHDGSTVAGRVHCGIMAPGNRVLHIERNSGCVLTPLGQLLKREPRIYRNAKCHSPTEANRPAR